MAARRIMVDGFNLSLEQGTGIATYARNLTYNLHAMGCEVDLLYGYNLPATKFALAREMSFFDPPDFRFSKWGRRITTARGFLGRYGGRKARPIPSTGLVVTDGLKARMPYFDRLYNSDNLYRNADLTHRFLGLNEKVRIVEDELPDLMHWTFPVPAEFTGTKNIYTIHDLVPMRLPYTTLDHNRHFVRLMEKIVAGADHIVTVSETSKRDIVSLLGVPEDRVTNTYQAVEIPEQFASKTPDIIADEVKGVFGLDYKRYFLFFGAIEPKKNVGRLIEAYLSARVEDPLVLVGVKAWKSDPELRLLLDEDVRTFERDGRQLRMKPKRRIMHFDYAPFSLLVSLIKGAKAVTVPSLYEGFGLPALEAMLLGTPVITSNQGSSPEICAEGALLVDPYKPRDIREAIMAIDANPDLAPDLSARGRKRAGEFSNEAYRDRLQSLYDRILKN